MIIEYVWKKTMGNYHNKRRLRQGKNGFWNYGKYIFGFPFTREEAAWMYPFVCFEFITLI